LLSGYHLAFAVAAACTGAAVLATLLTVRQGEGDRAATRRPSPAAW
jgi:hypothetical protein